MKKDLFGIAFDEITLPENAAVLDVGCRDAQTLRAIHERFPVCGKLIGVDKRSKHFESLEEQQRLGIQLVEADAAELNFPDNSFDLIFHKNMLECIRNIPAHIRELHRVLKPGGHILCIHCDWESIVLNGSNKRLINKVIYEYANFLQPGWMDTCDGWIGRRLWGYFHSSGLFEGTVDCYNHIETDYHEGLLGWGYIHEMEGIEFLTKAEYEELLADMQSAADHGTYLFSRPYYLYKGRKLSKD